MTTQYINQLIWKELEPLENGYVPKIKRRYLYTGESRAIFGETFSCEVPVTLTESSHPAFVKLCPEAAMHVLHCPDSVDIKCVGQDWLKEIS